MMNAWYSKFTSEVVPWVPKDSKVPTDWLAGLCYVECSSLNPKASRFEKGVYMRMLQVREGKKNNFYGGPLGTAIRSYRTIEEIRPLATSYGLVQIMGYNYFNMFGVLPEDFSSLNLEKSVHYSLEWVKHLMQTAKTYEELLRLHNTGRVTGKTYDPNYVVKATAAMEGFKIYHAHN